MAQVISRTTGVRALHCPALTLNHHVETENWQVTKSHSDNPFFLDSQASKVSEKDSVCQSCGSMTQQSPDVTVVLGLIPSTLRCPFSLLSSQQVRQSRLLSTRCGQKTKERLSSPSHTNSNGIPIGLRMWLK